MVDDEITATLSMDADDQLVRLPSGWHLPGTRVRVRREGERVVLEPVYPPAHPSWPPEYVAWLRDPENAFDAGDPDELRRAFDDPTPP
ncbi:hypothetical protein tb265_09320 [Gemmatimonadetes bacterium T265]|nr:hypothetical protein tb265_09320 [Gemmatimonadetes bacterium T265]